VSRSAHLYHSPLVLFPTFTFFVFFVTVWGVFWLLPARREKHVWLLAASAIFYAFWSPWFLGLIFVSTSIDYAVALRLPSAPKTRRRALLLLSVGVNLGILASFKYAGFAVESAVALANAVGLDVPAATLETFLPLGISFYTFEAICYVVDVYRGRQEPVRRPLDYALYILFFPHLVAGPIVRPHEFLPQLARDRCPSWSRFVLGLRLFLMGLFKKAVIADHLAAIVDPVFASPDRYDTATLWLAVLGYSVQIYCDFSGYTDMAVGIAHTFSFKLPANFDTPYLASNIADFWRRWHMTLSRWLRDYVYVPLGGGRGSSLVVARSLVVTMFLGGLWHGAAWHFVVWGLYHGALLALHRLVERTGVRVPAPLGVVATFLSVSLGWVLFRCATLTVAMEMLARLVVPHPGLTLRPAALVGLGVILAFVALCHAVYRTVDLEALARRLPAPALGAALAATLLLVQLLMPATGQPFIYFQF